MTLSDELIKLEQLRDRGSLTSDEFARTKARLLDSPLSVGPKVASLNGLRRSQEDRWIGGVCGGLAVATGMDAWFWRFLFSLLFFVGGSGLLLYILLWIFVPSE